MSFAIDLKQLSIRESEQTEWKENVADIDNVVATLSAFANDLQNMGGGYVVCGAKEDKDEHGFPRLVQTGLTATRLKEVEGTVLTRCRERVSPPITPIVEELPAATGDRRILVFLQPATAHAHTFRRGDEGAKHYVRVSRSTIEARNGVLRELLVRKRALEPWDWRGCSGATVEDLDLLALREALQRMSLYNPAVGLETYLSSTKTLSPLVPPLCIREPLTGTLRPRNFAMLLFGRQLQRFVPGAVSFFSQYQGTDRSEPFGERHELTGTLLEQASRLVALLDAQAITLYDKENRTRPAVLKYPARALREAAVNALAHRDYELNDPLRITVYSDRIELVSPGPLPLGLNLADLRRGRVTPHWRNQALAWFLSRLGFAEAEGQGVQTMLRTLRAEGSPAPLFRADEARVICIVRAHPRWAEGRTQARKRVSSPRPRRRQA